MNFKRRSTLYGLLICLSFYSSSSLAIPPTIQEITSITFGQLVPKSGFCELDPADGSLTTTNQTCIGNSQLAHYRITADPNTAIRIRFNQVIDSDEGLQFQPTARMENNLGANTLWYFTGSETTVTTGTDGILDIFVGGRLTINNGLSGTTGYQLNFDVDFRYPP